MAISWNNLNGYVKSRLNGNYPDIGEIFYLVDSDFRTHAQGWSQADGTGPVDLYAQMAPGRVFYAPGNQPSGVTYANDRGALQAAIDAAVDFRGDTVFLTPGSYTLATTAVAFDVPNMRVLGPPTNNPRRTTVTIDDNIGDNTLDADNIEFGFFKVLPLTTASFLLSGTANEADNTYFHHLFWDSAGVAGDELYQTSAGQEGVEIYKCLARVDTASTEDFLTLVSPDQWHIHDCVFIVEGVTWASVFTWTTGAEGMLLDNLHFNGSGASSVFTNLITGVANADMQAMVTRCFVNGTAMTTASAIETTFGTTGDIDIAECYQTGDATGEGGVVIALA